MKKILFGILGILGISLLLSGQVLAQGMPAPYLPASRDGAGMGFSSAPANSAAVQSQQEEEQEGKKILDDLGTKTISCSQLNDSDFEKVGEYFMGQSIKDVSQHLAMNQMMKSMMGKKGEEQMHVAWGKRGSECDTSGFNQLTTTPMMWGFGNSPMGWGFGAFGWIFMLLFWVLLIVGVVALIKWLMSQSGGAQGSEHSALDILKARYAKGEIDKKEFEEKKKDLS